MIESFKTKTIKVQAVQITPGNIRELADWARSYDLEASVMTIGAISAGTLALRIHTERATVDGAFGDWVVVTDAGDFEMWPDEEFHERFEAA